MPKVSLLFVIFSNLINQKPFRLSKNGRPTNLFKKVPGGNTISFDKQIPNNNINNNRNVIKINLTKTNELSGENEEQIGIEEDEK